ncbi:hypothetical protein PAXRUDRAFT_85865, partial [Paxillus rubicundulus Ve08.2h10]
EPCCERCQEAVSRNCCDICNRALSATHLLPLQQFPSTRAKRKFKTKPYTMSQGEDNLRKELIHWREMKMIEEDLDGDDFFGPQIIMSNKILHCIIDLAHYLKLTTPTSLLEQTGWCYSMDYGPEIIQLIKAKIPFPVPQPSTT